MNDKVNIKEQLELLKRLQAVDSEMYDLTAEKETFPARISEIAALLETKKTGMEEADKVLKDLQVEQKERENDLQSCEEKIKKHESELAQIKTNKEYKAMLEQIESLKADISLLEEKIIVVLDKIEEAKRKFAAEKDAFDEERKRSDAEKSAIEEEKKKVEARLKELADLRSQFMGPVDPAILKRYEKILENKGKTALSAISGEFCSECNMRLRPQVINEARLNYNIVICENCQRILYPEE